MLNHACHTSRHNVTPHRVRLICTIFKPRIVPHRQKHRSPRLSTCPQRRSNTDGSPIRGIPRVRGPAAHARDAGIACQQVATATLPARQSVSADSGRSGGAGSSPPSASAAGDLQVAGGCTYDIAMYHVSAAPHRIAARHAVGTFGLPHERLACAYSFAPGRAHTHRRVSTPTPTRSCLPSCDGQRRRSDRCWATGHRARRSWLGVAESVFVIRVRVEFCPRPAGD